jgi:hypothetical protein
MYSKLTKRNFPWMMFFLNIELHQSIVAFTALYSHDMSPNNIQEYPEYIQSISRVYPEYLRLASAAASSRILSSMSFKLSVRII